MFTINGFLCWSWLISLFLLAVGRETMLAGVFYQRFKSLDGTVADGTCCDNKTADPNNCPPDQCDVVFSVCGTRMKPGSMPCHIFQDSLTKVMYDDDEFVMGTTSLIGNKFGQTHPLIVFNYDFFPEPIRFEVYVYDFDNDSSNSNNTQRELIANWTIQTNEVQPLYTGMDAWIKTTLRNSAAELEIWYVSQCRKTYFGPDCSTYCDPTYQYTCLKNGTRNCTEGWSGPLCDVMIDHCIQHNCRNGGTCVNFLWGYNCSCSFGFEGAYCEINITALNLTLTTPNASTAIHIEGKGVRDKKSDSSLNSAEIGYIVLGTLLLLCLIAATIIYLVWRKKQRRERSGKVTPDSSDNKVDQKNSDGKMPSSLTFLPYKMDQRPPMTTLPPTRKLGFS